MENIVRTVGYVLLFAIDLTIYRFLHSHFLFMTLVLMILAPVISLLMLLYLRKHIDVNIVKVAEEVKSAERFTKGETVFVKIKVENKTPLTCLDCKFNLEVSNAFLMSEGTKEFAVPVRALKGYELDLPIEVIYSGIVSININKIALKDLMGFFRLKKDVSAKKEIIVLPREESEIFYERTAYEVGMVESDESSKRGNDYSDVNEIREYIPGDLLTNIHWKLTAKKDELMVKDRVSMSDAQMVVVMELCNQSVQMLDSIINTTYSIIKKLIDDKVTVKFMYWSVTNYDFVNYRLDYREELDEAFSKMFYEKTYVGINDAAINMRNIHTEIKSFVHVTAGAGGAMVAIKENV